MSIDWKDLQYSFKQLHISLTDVQNKEIEMQKILSSSLNLYYKYKRKILLYINNIQGFMGLNKNIFYQDTIKVKVEGANKDDVYIFGPLKTYLLLFRNNFGNLFKFLNYLKPEEFGKIALLLTHFFYEDITLNESSDALNYIYFHLLSNELNNFCDSYFLDSYISQYSLTAKVTEQLLQRNEIKLYISTPGGSTFAAWSMIDVIESSKTPIVGVCFDMCASAGFYIYISCHERIAFKNSAILEHDGDIAIENSSKKAKDVMAFFETMDQRLKEHVLKHTFIDSEFYDSIYETEFWFFAEKGKELGVVDKIIGEDVDINYIL